MADKNDGKAGAQDAGTALGGQDSTSALLRQLVEGLQSGSKSDADEARARERSAILRRQDAEDAARAKGGNITVVAITSFTIVEDAVAEPRMVQVGDELEIPLYDLPAWSGRVRPKELDAVPEAPPSRGVKISG